MAWLWRRRFEFEWIQSLKGVTEYYPIRMSRHDGQEGRTHTGAQASAARFYLAHDREIVNELIESE